MDALRNRLESSGAYPLYKLQLLEGLMPYLKTVAVRKNTLWSKNTGAWGKGPTHTCLCIPYAFYRHIIPVCFPVAHTSCIPHTLYRHG